ncbi:hypothetical protein EB796_012725 [Bugula neritina]|uniref:SAT2 n=1 Tax=Bugula neritina TaxID=10212 RepID=A0A7J7JTI0_BUGNE|nr:hypothetical protein EB796_012725 [Bugula neritina]
MEHVDKLIVREATEEDFTQIHPLIIKRTEEFGLPTSHVPNIKKLVEDYSSKPPKFYCLVCEIDTRIVGYLIYSFGYCVYVGRYINMSELYALATLRKEVQLQLFTKIINISLEMGCFQLEWVSSKNDLEFHEFSVETGATVIPEEDGYHRYQLDAKKVQSD